jgi:cytosine/adenosine deaminase-related metal-dependent hydrolase
MESYKQSGLLTANPETAGSHADAVLNEITQSGNLVLVHNLYTDIETIRKVRNRNNLYWCLCPNSNLYIENKLPPVGLLIEEGCEIVIGTDSLASNSKLNILEELKTLHLNFPSLSLEELIKWATLNGARALCAEENFGQIRPDTKPGLILIQNVDLINMKLLPESFVTRLV